MREGVENSISASRFKNLYLISRSTLTFLSPARLSRLSTHCGMEETTQSTDWTSRYATGSYLVYLGHFIRAKVALYSQDPVPIPPVWNGDSNETIDSLYS